MAFVFGPLLRRIMLELPVFRRDLGCTLIYTRSMSLPLAVCSRFARAALLFACSALFVGCTTSPTSGRTQFNILPGELETTVPSLRFDVKTLLAKGGDFCSGEENPCPAQEAADKLAQRIAPIAERLGTKAAELSPELVRRVPHVEVFVVPNDSPSVSSSAGGKIAVSSGLARLALTDTDLALALAREFGRLASAHHRESASAGLAVSLIAGSPLTGAYLATTLLADILFPMGALARLGISLLASMGTEQLVEASQQEEADAFAAKLMLMAGYDPQELAEPRDALKGTATIGWLSSYFVSRTKVAAMAQPDPWPDEAPAPTAMAIAPEPWPDEALPAVAVVPDPWPDEAPTPAAVVVALEPWPDEAHTRPEPPAGPGKTASGLVAQLAASQTAVGDTGSPQVAPSKIQATKAQGRKKPAVKKPKKKPRVTAKKQQR